VPIMVASRKTKKSSKEKCSSRPHSELDFLQRDEKGWGRKKLFFTTIRKTPFRLPPMKKKLVRHYSSSWREKRREKPISSL